VKKNRGRNKKQRAIAKSHGREFASTLRDDGSRTLRDDGSRTRRDDGSRSLRDDGQRSVRDDGSREVRYSGYSSEYSSDDDKPMPWLSKRKDWLACLRETLQIELVPVY
jgi:hypothetical protein